MEELSWFQTIIIAIVEGLTEFLPVSSTGHMIIAQNMLGVPSSDFVKAFTVIIQFGAILSVVVLYWKRFFKLNPCKIFDSEAVSGKTGSARWVEYGRRFLYKYDFYWKLLVAFIPAAFFGLLFSDKWFNKTTPDQTMTLKRAFNVGLFQCIAMIPGVSRSMATIVGGMAQKMTRKNAAEFSFFLAVPTMFAATAYKLLKLLTSENGMQVLQDNLLTLIVGNVVAFIVALLAIKFFISFVTKYGFKAFGYYRIIVGGIIIVLMLLGYNLEIS